MTAEAESSLPPQPRALNGVRVVELGTFISGPFAGTLLADFGAEVIKIELPKDGDPMRTLGASPAAGESSYWWSVLGRNKRSVGLDVRTAAGREILGRLVESADVFIENFRPGTLERWDIGPRWLKERRPGIVILRISGYGQDGPLRDLPGLDRNAQAFSGLVYVTGEPDTAPQQVGLPMSDYVCGLWGAFGVLMALLGQHLQGDRESNEIDLALYEATLPFLKDIPSTYHREGRVTERSGNTPDYVAPGGAYRTKGDEWVFISGTGDRLFARLMTAIDRSDLASVDDYRDNRERVANRESLDAAISAWTTTRTTSEIVDVLERAGVPVARINSIADLMAHPQVAARKNFINRSAEGVGEVCLPAPMPRMQHLGPSVDWLGEELGQSTRQVLMGHLGLTELEVAALEVDGVIGPASGGDDPHASAHRAKPGREATRPRG